MDELKCQKIFKKVYSISLESVYRNYIIQLNSGEAKNELKLIPIFLFFFVK